MVAFTACQQIDNSSGSDAAIVPDTTAVDLPLAWIIVANGVDLTPAMNDDRTRLQDWRERLDLPEAHELTLTGERSETRRGSRHESRWWLESDAQHRPVARYRTWIRQSLQPPYRRQLGWERYCLKGQLLDREIHYSRRDPGDHLH